MTLCDAYTNRFQSQYTAVLEMYEAPTPGLMNEILLTVYRFAK